MISGSLYWAFYGRVLIDVCILVRCYGNALSGLGDTVGRQFSVGDRKLVIVVTCVFVRVSNNVLCYPLHTYTRVCLMSVYRIPLSKDYMHIFL